MGTQPRKQQAVSGLDIRYSRRQKSVPDNESEPQLDIMSDEEASARYAYLIRRRDEGARGALQAEMFRQGPGPSFGGATAPVFPRFGGRTYSPELDRERLTTALGRVWDLMRDGEWRSLRGIAEAVGCSEAGASARLRDLRKPRFAAILPTLRVDARRRMNGLWEYRVDVPQEWRR